MLSCQILAGKSHRCHSLSLSIPSSLSLPLYHARCWSHHFVNKVTFCLFNISLISRAKNCPTASDAFPPSVPHSPSPSHFPSPLPCALSGFLPRPRTHWIWVPFLGNRRHMSVCLINLFWILLAPVCTANTLECVSEWVCVSVSAPTSMFSIQEIPQIYLRI